MKLRMLTISLLLSSALSIPAALAQQDNNNAASSTNASQSAATAQPANNASTGNTSNANSNANASTNTQSAGTSASAIETSGWTGKTVTGSGGKKLGTVTAAENDKVTLKTRYGNVDLAAMLVADNGSGDLTAETTSLQDVQAMAKSQQGDMKGAEAVSKRNYKRVAQKASEMPSNETATPSVDQAPAGQAPEQPAATTPKINNQAAQPQTPPQH